MDFFTVRVNCGSAESEERFKALIQEAVSSLHNREVRLSFQAAEGGMLEALLIGRPDSSGGGQAACDPQLIDLLSLGIAEYIISEKEEEVAARVMRRDYSFESREEAQQVHDMVDRLLAEEAVTGCAREERKALVQEALREYLQSSSDLHLEGFVWFRLKAYEDKLREIVDYAVDEFLLDKQYEEFIGLLQYFVYFQEPLTPLVHLMHKHDHEFAILNEQFTPIRVPASGGVVARIADQEMQMEDVIVSTLISLSPDRILIHTQEPDAQVITTISRIFGDRVEICLLCPHCQLFHQETRRLDQG
ncbi:putative sporulation protein YtxC [Paenibacillus sp. oral taxon 786 str. D14]|uniref:putative sporulation protein YtxC n=1 Tax=unclassified Paenibacillus TaxID=185978 RepID=UPI0001AFD8BC|nr:MULTISPECIES: putative sporulation protein YtxC [unclassified Paenibacillus]EES71086.1 putative sporulation protein YtxC [Paenibacillus sp. oral taxon 786 str. D14]MCT2195884.1 putative sporulation protein YtxC [Paenibacillus sp. p3-SID1389]